MADIVNGRCHDKRAPETGPPLFQHGKLTVQAHDIGWLVSLIFTVMASVISFWLMSKHFQWYSNKAEQRYITRILLMVPIYSVVSLASYLFWNHSTPLLLLRDCYESTVLTSFFYLLLMYISPEPEEQKEVFRKVGLSRQNDRERIRAGDRTQHWMFPFSGVKWKPEDGLYFLQLMKWGVLQYCVIRPVTTLAAVVLDYAGLYCEDSWSPGWGHLYISVIVSASVSIAMYCLLQLYMPISSYLQPQKPLLKLFAVKAVVFLTFWQATGLSMLATFGLVKDTPYMTADNINIGIGAIIETVEMTIFALLHIKAFSYKPYVTSYPTNRWRAFLHAFNFKETIRELWAGTIYVVHKMRGREVDVMARRQAALEGVFGQSRIQIQSGRIGAMVKKNPVRKERDPLAISVAVEETVHIGAERQWLGVGDDYAYGLGYHSRSAREKSDGLEDQIEGELAARGYSRQPSSGRQAYSLINAPESEPNPTQSSRRNSWWRNMYYRLSVAEPPKVKTPQIAPASFTAEKLPPIDQRATTMKPLVTPYEHHYDDPPPPSVIRSYRETQRKKSTEECPPNPSVFRPDETSIINAFQPSSQRSRPNSVVTIPRPLSSSQPPTPSSNYSDSFLGRAFAAHSDASTSAEALSSTSQSHAAQVPLAGRPTLPVNLLVPNMPKLPPSPGLPPFSVTRSFTAVTSPESRPDSFLARAFPASDRSDASRSSEALSSVIPSSQSHETRVKLSGSPRVVESGQVVTPQAHLVPHPESHGPVTREPRKSNRRSAAEWGPAIPELPSSSSRQFDRYKSLPSPPITPSHSTTSTPPRSPVVKSRLRRDQIVLPAPLASAEPANSSSMPASPPPPGLSSPPQLYRSKGSNRRRHSDAFSPHQSSKRDSRRVSFPLPHATIVEGEVAATEPRRPHDS